MIDLSFVPRLIARGSEYRPGSIRLSLAGEAERLRRAGRQALADAIDSLLTSYPDNGDLATLADHALLAWEDVFPALAVLSRENALILAAVAPHLYDVDEADVAVAIGEDS
jgi:hypothetical protein